MVKKLLSLALVLILTASVLSGITAFVLFAGNVKGETYYVNPGESIQSAIDGAANGDTVFVYSGTYNENINITKSIDLIGENTQATIINGIGPSLGIQISFTDTVNIMTLTVKNFNTGISISDSSDVDVDDVIIQDCGTSGVDADSTNDLRIINCNFTGIGTGVGIDTNMVADLALENNEIQSFLNGISMRSTDDPFIYGNSITSNINSGIMFEESSGGKIRNNYIADQNAIGINIYYVDDVLIRDNTLYKNQDRGLFASWSSFKMVSTSIDNSAYGVYFQDISTGKILNSSISNSLTVDLYVSMDRLIVVNTTFNHSKVIIAKQDAILEVKNYLEIIVEGSEGNKIEGADVKVRENEVIVYDSISGNKKTDINGTIGFLEVSYGVYEYHNTNNFTLITDTISADVIYNSFDVPIFESDADDIDMSYSHKETFIVDNTPPIISDVSSKGNVSQTINSLDRSKDASLAISFWASEPGQYVIVFDTDFDDEFNESQDLVIFGTVSLGFQTVFWNGGNESGLLTDDFYPMKIILIDDFANNISEPYEAMTVIILNSDLDGDGHLDINDDFPYEPTQWIDNDGDGFGDNPLGLQADLFPQDATQWFDGDNDGYGDNPEGNNPDMFPLESSQWIDSDGDGFGDNIFGNDSDAFPDDPTQWLDRDEDGWGDNQSGNKPDAFPDNLYEWKDSDGDGYGDNKADAFPDDANEWEDADSDGMGDNSDFLPSINNWLLFFIIGLTVVIVLVALKVFKGQKRAERPFDPGVSGQPEAVTPAAAPPAKTLAEPPRRARRPPPKKKAPPKKAKPKPPKEKAPEPVPPPPEDADVPPPPPPADEEVPPPPPDDAEETPHPPPEDAEETPPPPPKEEEEED